MNMHPKRTLLTLLSVMATMMCVACSNPTPANGNDEKHVTLREAKPGEKICLLTLWDDPKRKAKELSVGIWRKDQGEQMIVTFVLPDQAEFNLQELGIVVAEIPDSDQEHNAFIYAEGTNKNGERRGVTSTVARFHYLGKNEYALSWASKTTVTEIGRRNIQSVGSYDGSDFKIGTEHNRLILFYEVR